jgi:GNAT superfamily N-acetyltransferase
MCEINIRRATPEDAGIIADHALQLIEQHVEYDPVRFSRIGDHEGMAKYYAGRAMASEAVVLVAEYTTGNVVGFAYFEWEPILYADLAVKVAWLHDIFVESPVRRSGAGKLLIDAVVEEARRLGAEKVLLSVAARNASAKDFFEDNHFTTTMHEMMLVIGDNGNI